MVQSLQLGGASNKDSSNKRLNRIPIIIAIALIVLFLGVISYGLSSRGFYFQGADGIGQASNASASTYADQLKRGVKDAIIGDPEQTQIYQPAPVSNRQEEKSQHTVETEKTERARNKPGLEPEEEWLARLGREQKEQFLRERHRQQMASLQAKAAALDSPLAVDVSLKDLSAADTTQANTQSAKTPGGASDLYAAAMQAGLSGQNGDPNMGSVGVFISSDSPSGVFLRASEIFFIGRLHGIKVEHRQADAGYANRRVRLPDPVVRRGELPHAKQRTDLLQRKPFSGEEEGNALRVPARDRLDVVTDDGPAFQGSLQIGFRHFVSAKMKRHSPPV